jgi:ferredoxin
MVRFTVSVDPDLCGGHGECVVAAPEVFDFETDEVVSVLTTHPEEEGQRAAALEAESRCPNAAIRIERS